MRISNSMKNIYFGLISQIIIVLLGFISRKIFLDTLGTEYLGINGLLTNILSIVGLVEAGIGTSIVYNLYKPLADKDEPKIIALVQLYKKLYGFLAIIISILSIIIFPFIQRTIDSNVSISNLSLVYFILVTSNIITYINAHKWSLITADQKGYILTKYNIFFHVLTTILKIIILKITQNYVLFLLVELIIFTIKNLWNGKIVNKEYPYINTKKKYSLDKYTKKNIHTNVKAIFIQNIAKQMIYGTDNLLIAMLINIKSVGLYSNYSMITGQLWGVINTIIFGLDASVGNVVATESIEKKYEIFNIVYFVNFWIYSFCTVMLYILIQPFITWWVGEEFLLDNLTVVVLIFNFYISGLRSSISMFKEKAGLFNEDKYIRILEALFNLVASLILAKIFELAGIFLGTTLSTILVALWVQPKIVYNKVFNKPVLEYFKRYVIYLFITIIMCVLNLKICSLLTNENLLLNLIGRGTIGLVVVNTVYCLVFFKTKEFNYVWNCLNARFINIRGCRFLVKDR